MVEKDGMAEGGLQELGVGYPCRGVEGNGLTISVFGPDARRQKEKGLQGSQ